MNVVAQWVRTSWTKASRGGVEAARRAATPFGFPLADTESPLVHRVFLDESVAFEPRQAVREHELRRDEVECELLGDELHVMLVHDPFGRPYRRRRPPAVRLAAGEWVRWIVNYRFTGHSTGDWSYRQDVLNLACGQVRPDTFTGVPTRLVDERTRLR